MTIQRVIVRGAILERFEVAYSEAGNAFGYLRLRVDDTLLDGVPIDPGILRCMEQEVEVMVFGRQAELLAHREVGSLVEIEGRYVVETWANEEGVPTTRTRIMFRRLGFLSDRLHRSHRPEDLAVLPDEEAAT